MLMIDLPVHSHLTILVHLVLLSDIPIILNHCMYLLLGEHTMIMSLHCPLIKNRI